MNASLKQKALEARATLKEAEAKLALPETLASQKLIKEASMAFNHARHMAEVAEVYLSLVQAMADAEEAAGSDDQEMKDMGIEETARIQPELAAAEEAFELALVPPDPHDQNDIIMEIRAGAGGDEAGLFAGDLLRMYLRYAERRNWKSNLLSESTNETGGYKEVILGIQGAGAYGWYKFESGVHRVQRVPSTEKQGRIHTSTATVAVRRYASWAPRRKSASSRLRTGSPRAQAALLAAWMRRAARPGSMRTSSRTSLVSKLSLSRRDWRRGRTAGATGISPR